MLSILLAVPSCFNSFWHGVIPTSYFIFNDFYTCINVYTQDHTYILQVHEPKTKVDLTKYLENQNFQYVKVTYTVHAQVCINV